MHDQRGHLQGLQDTAAERQMKAMRQLVRAWPQAQTGELMTAWRVSRLQAAAYPWMVVAGPMAALQVYRMDWMIGFESPWLYLQCQLTLELQ